MRAPVLLPSIALIACATSARTVPAVVAPPAVPRAIASAPPPRSDPRADALRGSIRAYRAAIALAPERPEAWFDLGVLLLDVCPGTLENFERGHAHLRRAAELASREPRHAALAERARSRIGSRPCPPGTALFSSGRCGLTALPSDPGPAPPEVDCAALDAALR